MKGHKSANSLVARNQSIQLAKKRGESKPNDGFMNIKTATTKLLIRQSVKRQLVGRYIHKNE